MIGFLLAVYLVAVGAVLAVAYYRPAPLPLFSAHRTLDELWSSYKKTYLEAKTFRTLNTLGKDDATTARYEAQTMLQAVWMDDKPVFDQSWLWVKNNLQDRTTKQIATRFGKLPAGGYGVQERQADPGAETDIAFALLQAYSRWNNTGYAYDSLPVIQALWRGQVVAVGGKPAIARQVGSGYEVDSADLKPFAYRKFAYVDAAHNWRGVVDSSYDLLQKAADKGRLGVATNKVVLAKTGVIVNSTSDDQAGAQLLWNMAMDWQWNSDDRAYELLQWLGASVEPWRRKQALPRSSYGQALGYFVAVDSPLAAELYRTKLAVLYDPDRQGLYRQAGPYEDSWVWLGMAAYGGYLRDIAGTV